MKNETKILFGIVVIMVIGMMMIQEKGNTKKEGLQSSRYQSMCDGSPYMNNECSIRGDVAYAPDIDCLPPSSLSGNSFYYVAFTNDIKDCFEGCDGDDYSEDTCFVFGENFPCSSPSSSFGDADYCRYRCIIEGGGNIDPCEDECTLDDTNEDGGKCYKCVPDDDNFGAQCNEWVWTNDEFCEGPCVDFSWTPAFDTVCLGDVFTQTSNCGNFREHQGTKTDGDCTVQTCNTAADKDCNGCVADLEFPTAVVNWKQQTGGITDSLFPTVVNKWKNQNGC